MSQAPDHPHGTAGFGADKASAPLNESHWAYLQKRYELTPREVEIAKLVCGGLRNSSIARSLDIRPDTVKTHVRNIYRKVRVKSKINMLLRFIGEAM